MVRRVPKRVGEDVENVEYKEVEQYKYWLVDPHHAALQLGQAVSCVHVVRQPAGVHRGRGGT